VIAALFASTMFNSILKAIVLVVVVANGIDAKPATLKLKKLPSNNYPTAASDIPYEIAHLRQKYSALGSQQAISGYDFEYENGGDIVWTQDQKVLAKGGHRVPLESESLTEVCHKS
jgi:hypothetical protein